MKTLGIIGFGRFGQLVASTLAGIPSRAQARTPKPHVRVKVCDKKKSLRTQAREMGVEWASLEECAAADIVVLCVPIRDFEQVLADVALHVRAGAWVVDTCSVKSHPVKLMQRRLPKSVHCAGTHPLFGPDTAANGVEGKTVAVCPIRPKRPLSLTHFLERLGMKVVLTAPQEHDKSMARSLALLHFIGKGLKEAGVEKASLATPTHALFEEAVCIVQNDSMELLEDMHRFNPFAEPARRRFTQALQNLEARLS